MLGFGLITLMLSSSAALAADYPEPYQVDRKNGSTWSYGVGTITKVTNGWYRLSTCGYVAGNEFVVKWYKEGNTSNSNNAMFQDGDLDDVWNYTTNYSTVWVQHSDSGIYIEWDNYQIIASIRGYDGSTYRTSYLYIVQTVC